MSLPTFCNYIFTLLGCGIIGANVPARVRDLPTRGFGCPLQRPHPDGHQDLPGYRGPFLRLRVFQEVDEVLQQRLILSLAVTWEDILEFQSLFD